MEPAVAIILVNWNRKEDTLECISSLRKMDYKNFRIIVLDNGSNDGSQEFLRQINDIEFIDNGENLGIVKANNIGIKRALEAKVDFILLLNNDTVVEKSMLSILVEAFEKDCFRR